MKKQVAFTMSFEPDLYRRIKVASGREGRSITSFVKEAVAKKLAEEESAALFNAFTLVGEDLNEASVEFAHDAQRQVVLKDE